MYKYCYLPVCTYLRYVLPFMTLSPPLEFDVSGVGRAIRLLTAASLMHTRYLIDHAIASASSHYYMSRIYLLTT